MSLSLSTTNNWLCGSRPAHALPESRFPHQENEVNNQFLHHLPSGMAARHKLEMAILWSNRLTVLANEIVARVTGIKSLWQLKARDQGRMVIT